MNKKENIDKINFHLGASEGSFLYILHEKFLIDKEKFNDLIYNVKLLKKQTLLFDDIDKKFVYNLIDKLSYMYSVLRDVSIKQYKFNTNINKYYESILEITYELESLFNDDIIEDYNGNNY